MDELLKTLLNNPGGTMGAIVIALLVIAVMLPKLVNMMRADKLESNVLKRLQDAEAMIIKLSKSIHEHAIDVTLAQVMLLRMYYEMLEHGVKIPQEVQEYVNEIQEARARKKKEATPDDHP